MNSSSLFYICSIIEYIGRKRRLKRSELVNFLGKKVLNHIYNYADILHCEPIEKVADDFIAKFNIPAGDFDNVGKCKYTVPDYWDIGEVYSRVIEDTASQSHPIDALLDVFSSKVNDWISNYNSDFYYQPRDYIKECYLANAVLV